MTVGIDIGGKQHAVARCREGQDQAEREVLRISQDRAGFDRLDAWLARQEEPVGRITMESSGHYWMSLATHLKRGPVPATVVNPLGAKYFAKSRMSRTKSDPADARSLALMAQQDHTIPHDPLEGVELRQASRFAMTLVTEQARVCQRLVRLVELGFPELGELFDDPACRTAREVLRVAPTAAVARRRRVSTLAAANAGPGHRRLGETKAERLKAAAVTSVAVAELDDEVTFEVGLLLDQYELYEDQISAAEEHLASLLDGELARRLQTIPGVGACDLCGAHRRDRRHLALRRRRPVAGLCRGPPRRAQLGQEGRGPRDVMAHEQGRQRPPARCRLSHGRRGRDPQPRHQGPLRAQAQSRQEQDERPGPLHGEGAQPRLGRLAQWGRLGPRLAPHGLDKTLWDLRPGATTRAPHRSPGPRARATS